MKILLAMSLTFAVCASLATTPAPAAHIVAWEFEATIVNIIDPDRLFGDVQLGDTVRGTFRYDLTTETDDPSQLPQQARYTHASSFEGVYVVIENPRSGGQLEYLPTADGAPYAVTVWDDPDPAGESEVLFGQWAIPPVPEVWPGPLIQFGGANVLEDASLPTEYNLNDWPLAVVYFGGGNIFEGIDAQIYSLTSIVLGDFDADDDRDGADFLIWQRGNSPEPISAVDLAEWQANFNSSALLEPAPDPTADFNSDDRVDGVDLSIWETWYGTPNPFGSPVHVFGDADEDGDIDGGDFLVWQREFGYGVASSASSTNVPEPSTLLLGAMAVVGLLMRRKY